MRSLELKLKSPRKLKMWWSTIIQVNKFKRKKWFSLMLISCSQNIPTIKKINLFKNSNNFRKKLGAKLWFNAMFVEQNTLVANVIKWQINVIMYLVSTVFPSYWCLPSKMISSGQCNAAKMILMSSIQPKVYWKRRILSNWWKKAYK
jgi:hypothetical protein